MKVAYADPPYIGQARKHYAHDPRCAEVDHAELIRKLETYDGWALSCSSPSLKQILALCPSDVRIGAWVKPFCAFKPNVNPAYAWEPVIFKPARRRTREQMTVRDWVSEVITLKKGLVGVKPPNVAFWLFEILGLSADDELDDLFPGSGAISRAWSEWRGSMFASSVPSASEKSKPTKYITLRCLRCERTHQFLRSDWYKGRIPDNVVEVRNYCHLHSRDTSHRASEPWPEKWFDANGLEVLMHTDLSEVLGHVSALKAGCQLAMNIEGSGPCVYPHRPSGKIYRGEHRISNGACVVCGLTGQAPSVPDAPDKSPTPLIPPKEGN